MDNSPLGQKWRAPKLIGKTTAHKSFKRIWDLIMDDHSTIIGVHGMVGVGKTAIMKNVYNQLLETPHTQFHEVIWCTYSHGSFVHDLCKLTAKALKHKRKLVLILDDLFDAFSFDKIGLIQPNKENGCKLVFTTRSVDVCTRMECEQECIVKVGLLSEIEALELFFDTLKVKVNSKMTSTAEEIVKECSRLPLAIVSVANVLREKDEFAWGKILSKLRNSYGIMDITGPMVFMSLIMSFRQLQIYTRALLVQCALYPKGWKIFKDELTEYWDMALRNMGGIKLEGNHKCGEAIRYLESNGYLDIVEVDFDDYHEWGEGVQMHPLYRELALKAGTRQISKGGLMLEELPEEIECAQYLTQASFMCNNILMISISPNCPHLTTLLLNKNPDLCTISHHFFVHMPHLRILDLRDNYKMETLPDSLSDLVYLRALRLSRCRSLKQIPSVARLLSMEMLELDETAIEELPHGIEMLVILRVLKLHSLRLREPIPVSHCLLLMSRSTDFIFPEFLLSSLFRI